MNFKSLIKRDDNADSNVDTEFEELQTELADAFDECLGNLDEVTQLKDSDLTPLEDSDLTPLEDGDLDAVGRRQCLGRDSRCNRRRLAG